MKLVALIDCQNDFIDGALGVGYDKWTKAYDYIEKELLPLEDGKEYIFTLDSHPENHCSFKEQGGPWPDHCVKDTAGFKVYWKFEDWMAKDGFVYSYTQKGLDPDKEEYGVDVLKFYKPEDEITEVHVAGLCTDYCVKESAIMIANAHPNVKVFVHLNGSAYITEETANAAIEEMKKIPNIELVK